MRMNGPDPSSRILDSADHDLQQGSQLNAPMYTTKLNPFALGLGLRAARSILGRRVPPPVSILIQTRTYSIPTDLPVPKTKKFWNSAEEAVGGDAIKSGDTLLCGGAFFLRSYICDWCGLCGEGFGLAGIPGMSMYCRYCASGNGAVNVNMWLNIARYVIGGFGEAKGRQ